MKKIPTKVQLNFMDWEIGMFFHFGIRSFYPGRRDWDGIEMPAEGFNPTDLNCDQWMETAKSLGAKYAILTTKHHDGFALWQSKYSRYGVAQTPWKNGKGDVVREFVDACRRHGLKVGLYYSPAQWGSAAVRFENDSEYDDYFINQITELLSNYGKIDYLWFDGCGSEEHEYDKKRIVSEIFRLQPEIATFCDPEWTPCVRWVGNEDGYASLDNPLVVSKWDFSMLSSEAVSLSEAAFLPSECDCMLRSAWFCDRNEDSIKSLDELWGMYETSVGRGSNFLINVGPNDKGLIPEADKKRIAELGKKIKENYSMPLEYKPFERTDKDTLTITHPEYETPYFGKITPVPLVNTVEICEDLTDGQSITSFEVYAYLPQYKNKRILVFVGKTVGHKVYCRFGNIRSPKIDVVITGSSGDYTVKSINAYFVK